MSFSSLLVTNQGLNALAEVETGATLVITKVEAGSGYPASGDVIGNFTALKAYVMDADSTSTNTAVTYQTTIRCNITSTNAPRSFQINEFGVFASLNSQAPFLFAYSSTGGNTGDIVDPASPIIKEYVLPIVYSTTQQVTTSITMTDVVGLHASTHLSSGVDPLPISTHSIGGLCPKTPADATQVLIGSATASFGAIPLHGGTHVSTGRDPVPVATTAATGLVPVLSGKSTDVLLGTGAWGAGFFPGFVTDYAGAAAPAGWLLCDGQAYSRTTYAALFAALGGIGSPWGQGDGSATFNVPDLRGRVTIGFGQGAGLTNRPLGGTGGEENHLLTLGEIPSHTHAVNDPGHAHSVYDPTHAHGVYDPGHVHSISQSPHAHGVYDPGHAHSMSDPGHTHIVYWETNEDYPGESQPPGSTAEGWDYTVTYGKAGIARYDVQSHPSATGIGIYAAGTGIGIYAINANISIAGAGTSISIYKAATNIAIYSNVTGVSNQNSGGGLAHANMQPYAVLNRIIKT
jgi:microcystin-dependent protein